MRRQKQVCLSAFVNDKTEIPNKKLSLASKSISLIDQLNPYISSSTESLDLHNNRLTSLKGIEQFTFLKELDISQNKIQNCEELAKLKELYQLKKLYLSNNPFLNQPIPENILDFILDKETDIEILSFQILSTLKDVEERQIKIIFLKNYIQKIDMHAQLKDKKKLMHQKTAMEADQILNKIVPQFYTLIQDPKIINKIKREAIDKKKQTHDTLQEALEVTKHQKQEKIDELVKNIVGLLHENEQFKKSRSFMLEVNLNDNTITFSPQRRKENHDNVSLQSQEFSPVKYIQMSRDDASIEEISLTNTKQNPTAANTSTKPFQPRINEQTLQMYSSKPISPSKGDFDNLETARKHSNIKTLSEKLKEHSQFKQNMQSQIKKIKQRQSFINSKIAQSQYIEQKDNHTPQKKGFDMSKVKKNLNSASNTNNFIKVIEENQDESQENKQSLQEKEISKPEPHAINLKNYQTSSLINQSSIVINDQMTPQMMETVYFKTLAKTNPMFGLLHSPSNSLNNQQKNQVLQALKVDHKQKFLQLIKERLSNQQLMREIEQLKTEHSRQMQNIITNNKSVYNQYLVYKEQFEWIDQRQRSIQQNNQELAVLLKETQANDKKKATALKILENNYKKLKEAYGEKHERVIFLENAQEREEIIRQKHQANILKKYLKQMDDKAGILAKVARLNKKVTKNRQKQLLKWGIQSFIFNRLQQRAAKHLLRMHELNIVKQHFNDWKICNKLERKQKKVTKWVIQKRSKEIMDLFKRNQAESKMKKLKYIWAKRFLEGKLYKKSLKSWNILKNKADTNLTLSIKHSKHAKQAKIFRQLRQIVLNRKSYIGKIYDKRSNRLIMEEFKRMIYIMRKETAQIDQKYRKTVLIREQLQRCTYFRKFTDHASDQKQLKGKKTALKKQLAKKNFSLLKKVYKQNKRKLDKLKNFCFKLNFGVYIRMMKREKSSNDYSDTLLKRRKIGFFKNLRQNYHKQSNFHKNQQKMGLVCDSKLHFSKLKFLKRLEIFKLKGKNYVKHRAIQQMNLQMDLNELNTIDLIRSQKQEVTRCEKQIIFLKSQIQGQSIRELALLRQKDDMMLSINESYEIMMELRREVDAIRAEYGEQEEKYNSLVALYNQSVAALQKKERDYEWLYDSIRDHKIK